MTRPDTSSPYTDPYRVRFLFETDLYAEALENAGYVRNLNEGIMRKKLPTEPQTRGVLPMHAGHPRSGKRNQAFYERDMEV